MLLTSTTAVNLRHPSQIHRRDVVGRPRRLRLRPGQRRRCLGSSDSLSPSPMKLSDSTVRKMMSPGKVVIHQDRVMNSLPCARACLPTTAGRLIPQAKKAQARLDQNGDASGELLAEIVVPGPGVQKPLGRHGRILHLQVRRIEPRHGLDLDQGNVLIDYDVNDPRVERLPH